MLVCKECRPWHSPAPVSLPAGVTGPQAVAGPEPEQVPASARDPVLHSLLRDPGPVTTNKPTFLFNPLLQMFSWFIPFQSLAPTQTQSHLLFTLAGAPPLPSPAAGSPPLPPCRSGGRFSDGPVVIYMSVSLARL